MASSEAITLTDAEIGEARNWIADCEWGDLEPEDIADLTAAEITRGVARHYDGGLAAFIVATGMRPVDVAGMAPHPAGTCDGCGNEAVELATWREDDEIGGPGHLMSYCRPCMGDDAADPSLVWVTGEAI